MDRGVILLERLSAPKEVVGRTLYGSGEQNSNADTNEGHISTANEGP